MSDPPRTKSGQHPAVKAYREKLASIETNQVSELDALNAELEEYLTDTKSIRPPPPPPPDEPPTRPSGRTVAAGQLAKTAVQTPPKKSD